MEIITERDVLRLANALSVKCDINVKLDRISQCSSDFILTLYNAVMGELPIGVLADCTSRSAHEHNMACVIDTLADDYLHVDLSHITPQFIVACEPTTVYNLLEILDGLFEFMLDQISNGLNSGDEGDIDSDVMSEKPLSHTWGPRERRYSDIILDSSTNTAELIALDKKKAQQKSAIFSDIDDESFVPLKKSTSPELKSVGSISEHTLDSAELDMTVTADTSNDRTESLLRLAETQVKQLAFSDAEKQRLRSTYTTEKQDPMKATYKVDGKSSENEIQKQDLRRSSELTPSGPGVVLESSDKGSVISVSDVTSEGTTLSGPPSVVLEDQRPVSIQKSSSSTASSSGVDEPDGIPKPVIDEDLRSISSIERSPHTLQRRPAESGGQPLERDWVALLNNLQKTVNESRKIREKYFATPQPDSTFGESQGTEADESVVTSHDQTESIVSRDSTRPKSLQRNVRFEDTISTKTAKELKQFREVLRKEKQLQNLKNKVLSESYRDHLDEVEESEREKLKPLAKRAQKTEKDFNSRMKSHQRKPVKKGGVKKDLAAAAKWKSWQTPIVRKTPRRHPISPGSKMRGNMEIGEHDLLPLLISEFPGLQLSSHFLNNAWKKQFRQIEVLTSRETQHHKTKIHKERQLQEAHERHQLLTDIMRREHEQTQRVRDAKERQAGRREAQRSVKDKRQQSARVRRYYRDYQLQMRARMLKRRTKEERLFRNLFEEGLEIQRSRLREIRKYARDKREIQQARQKDEIASLENYYKDQFAILAETLDTEKKELRVRDKAQTELLRRMKSGLRQKMEREISDLQERITRDDEEVYFREMEADRIRRQLQLATYHAKFDSSLAKSM